MTTYHLIPWSKYGNWADGKLAKIIDGEKESYNFQPQANTINVIAQLVSSGRIRPETVNNTYQVIFNDDTLHVLTDDNIPVAHLYKEGTEQADIPQGPEDLPDI